MCSMQGKKALQTHKYMILRIKECILMNTKFSTLLAACLMAGVLSGTTAYAADTTTAPEAAKTENVDKAASPAEQAAPEAKTEAKPAAKPATHKKVAHKKVKQHKKAMHKKVNHYKKVAHKKVVAKAPTTEPAQTAQPAQTKP